MNFIYTVDPAQDEPIMLINKHIGNDPVLGDGIMGHQFQSELMALDAMGKRKVNVWINSVGGSVIDGEMIYGAILNTYCKVDTYCMGLAASIAAVIFQAGRKRIMADYGKLMYHNVSNGTNDQLRAFTDSVATMIESRTGKDKATVLTMMAKTTWMNANDAESNGFCDQIQSSSQANKGRLSRVTEPQALWMESVTVMNSILNINKPTMIKVTNKLGLVDGANEESILSAISNIENSYKGLEAEHVAVKNKLTETETTVLDLQNKLSAFEKAESERSETEKIAKEIAVKNDAKLFSEELVKVGKLKNDVKAIENVINAYCKDAEAIKEIYNSMPINKIAPSIGNNTSSIAPTNAMAKMHEIKQKLN